MVNSFRIKGGNKLYGDIRVAGSKNSATKLIAATLLTRETCTLVGLPRIRDVEAMLDILRAMGAEVESSGANTYIRNAHIDPKRLPYDKIIKLRSSIVLLGPMLARFQIVKLPYPGGDKIGARSIDTHLNAFEDLGCSVSRGKIFFTVKAPRTLPKAGQASMSRGEAGKVILDEFSVTATENLLMYASSLPHTLEISTAAYEPHIVSLCEFLNKMGAKCNVLAHHKIKVKGTSKFKGVTHKIIADYIEAGTFVCMVLAVGGDVRIRNFPVENLELFLHKLKRAGAQINIENKKTVRVKTSPDLELHKIQTMIYPGIPTDLQSPLGVLASCSRGTTLLHDPLYEGRLDYLKQLKKMGANIKILDPHRAQIKGPSKLHGTSIKGKDIRGGMSLIIAGLCARGTTLLQNAQQVERGYENITKRLRALGANIKKVT